MKLKTTRALGYTGTTNLIISSSHVVVPRVVSFFCYSRRMENIQSKTCTTQRQMLALDACTGCHV